MLDLVDRVIKEHIQRLLVINGRQIPVYSVATADQDDQDFTQAGMSSKKPDRPEFPFVSLIRTPNINITDFTPTKRVHNYTGYEMAVAPREGIKSVRLSYYRCSLPYYITVFGENRKVTEDIVTALYGALRVHCQVIAKVYLPVETVDEEGNEILASVEVPMDSDIELSGEIQGIAPIKLDTAQLWKCRISFTLANVNIYNPTYTKKFKYRIYFQAQLDDTEEMQNPPEPQLVLHIPSE